MMMILGVFVFELNTVPYQSFERNNTWRHAKNARIGASPRYQYVGPDAEPVTLSGTLYPEISGGDLSLAALRAMAYTGKPWPLIEATGAIYGMFVIKALRQTRTEFLSDGKARKIDFTLELEKVSEDLLENINEYAGEAMDAITDFASNL
ncbi:phage tail protein [Gibbsiella dentisursi]